MQNHRGREWRQQQRDCSIAPELTVTTAVANYPDSTQKSTTQYATQNLPLLGTPRYQGPATRGNYMEGSYNNHDDTLDSTASQRADASTK